MIQVHTEMNVADNSGAKESGSAFRVLGATRRRYAYVGGHHYRLS